MRRILSEKEVLVTVVRVLFTTPDADFDAAGKGVGWIVAVAILPSSMEEQVPRSSEAARIQQRYRESSAIREQSKAQIDEFPK